jgi:hypothetical protein
MLVLGVALALASRRPGPPPGPAPIGSAGPAERTPGTPTATPRPSATPTPSRTPTPSATPTAAGGGGLVAYVLDGELRLVDGSAAWPLTSIGARGDPDFAPDAARLQRAARVELGPHRLELNDYGSPA